MQRGELSRDQVKNAIFSAKMSHPGVVQHHAVQVTDIGRHVTCRMLAPDAVYAWLRMPRFGLKVTGIRIRVARGQYVAKVGGPLTGVADTVAPIT